MDIDYLLMFVYLEPFVLIIFRLEILLSLKTFDYYWIRFGLENVLQNSGFYLKHINYGFWLSSTVLRLTIKFN